MKVKIDEISKDAIRALYNLIEQNNLGTIWFLENNKPKVCQLPFFVSNILNAETTIFGFIKKDKFQNIGLRNEQELSISFTGNNSYVSPIWSKANTAFDWNYFSIIVQGQVQIENTASKIVIEQFVETKESKVERPLNQTYDIAPIIENTDTEYYVLKISIQDIDFVNEISLQKEELEKKQIVNELKKQNDFKSMLLAFEMEEYFKKEKMKVG